MKVLLIAPYINLNYGKVTDQINREDFYPSAALLHLGAILRANQFDVDLLDLNNSETHSKKDQWLKYCKKMIVEKVKELQPGLVGINCLFSGTFPTVLEFARTIKLISQEIKIATGGIHPTTFPKEILKNCFDIDFVAIGEGENAIVKLSHCLKEKKFNALKEIKSFGYRNSDGDITINSEKDYVKNLDDLPLPAWDLIDLKKFEMKLDHYYNPKELPIKHKAAIFSSRACPLACNFCDMFLIMGKTHRKRSIKSIVDEIEVLHKSHGINFFSFMDDQLTLNRAHIMGLCDEILRRKINIMFNTPNGLWVNSLREEVIAKMAEAGLVFANLAIEHGDDNMRNKVIGKILDRKKIVEVASLLKKYQVMTVGLFLMGFPEETNQTLQNSYDFMHELELENYSVQAVIPFPDTALFNQVVKDNLLLGKWNLDELWKTPISLGQSEFLIKPYDMSVDELHVWREKFDNIKFKFWKKGDVKASFKKFDVVNSAKLPRLMMN